MIRYGHVRTAMVVIAALGTPVVSYAQDQGHVGPDEARLDAAASLARRHEGTDVRWNLDAGTPARIRFGVAGGALRGETPAECAAHLLDDEVAPLLEPGVRTAPSDELAPAAGPALVVRETRDLGEGRVRVDFA